MWFKYQEDNDDEDHYADLDVHGDQCLPWAYGKWGLFYLEGYRSE